MVSEATRMSLEAKSKNLLRRKTGMAIETFCVRRIGADFSFKVFKRASQKRFKINCILKFIS